MKFYKKIKFVYQQLFKVCFNINIIAILILFPLLVIMLLLGFAIEILRKKLPLITDYSFETYPESQEVAG